MSFRLSVIGSVLLHGAVFSLIAAHPAFQRALLPSVATDRWVMDVSTVLLSEVPGNEMPPLAPAVIDSHEGAKVTSSPEVRPPNDHMAAREEPAAPALHAKNPIPAVKYSGEDSYSSGPVASAAGTTATAMSKAFANTMNVQAIVANLLRYRMTAVAHLKGGIGRALPVEERRTLDHATGTVVITFQDGNIESLSIESDNKQLRSLLLEQVDWKLLPTPRQFSLPISRIACTISVSSGKIRVGVGPT